MSRAPSRVEVLDPVDRWLHLAALAGTLGALASGPGLESPGLAALAGLGAGEVAAVHGACGLLALLAWAFHLVRVCLAWLEGRNPWGLLLRPSDLADLGRALALGLGLPASRPRLGRFSYRERLSYGGFLILLPALAATGWVLAHPARSAGLGAERLLGLASFHSAAGLFLGVALGWHLYFALLQPAALFWNGSWLTGRVPWGRVERTRPDWAREILATLPTGEPEPGEVPAVESLLEAANRSAREGRLEEAERGYLEALELYPGYSQALFNLGVVLFRGGRAREAEAALGRFLAQDPFSPVAGRARELVERLRREKGEA